MIHTCYNIYHYAPNPRLWIDPLGLKKKNSGGFNVFGNDNMHVDSAKVRLLQNKLMYSCLM